MIMIFSEMQEDDEQSSLNELVDPEDPGDESVPDGGEFSEDELDESEDEADESVPDGGEFSGEELVDLEDPDDEPVPVGGEFSEDELDESVPDEGEFSRDELEEFGDDLDESEDELEESGNELDESAPDEGEFSRDELEELGDDLDESEDEAEESVPSEAGFKGIWEKYKRGKALWLFMATGLFVLTGLGYFFMRGEKTDTLPHQKVASTQYIDLTIQQNQILVFKPFIIPFEEHTKFTYISLSISFNLPNREIKGEIVEKKDQLRGILYDILRKEINRAEEVPSLEKLKEFITNGTNAVLSTGIIKEVYINKFMAV